MPLYCSNTGSTALREAEVQQPITDATLSLTSSFFAFSAKVGQSLAPSSWMNLILRPSTPPVGVDLLDRELLGLHRAGLADRHGAGDGMQDADRDLGVGDREAGRVDLRGRKLLGERARRRASRSPIQPRHRPEVRDGSGLKGRECAFQMTCDASIQLDWTAGRVALALSSRLRRHCCAAAYVD